MQFSATKILTRNHYCSWTNIEMKVKRLKQKCHYRARMSLFVAIKSGVNVSANVTICFFFLNDANKDVHKETNVSDLKQ